MLRLLGWLGVAACVARSAAAQNSGWHNPGEKKADGSFFNKLFNPDKDKAAAPPIPPPGKKGSPKLFTYHVVQEHAHDQKAFTQGLECSKEKPGCETFYESTGLYGHTEVREVERETGTVLRRQSNIEKKWFGEGMVRSDDEFWLLTWKTNDGLVFDSKSLDFKRQFKTPMTDGWGLTINTDNGEWIGTDSTETMYFMKPSSDGSALEEIRRVRSCASVYCACHGHSIPLLFVGHFA
jgi:glutamine cyclotransferase